MEDNSMKKKLCSAVHSGMLQQWKTLFSCSLRYVASLQKGVWLERLGLHSIRFTCQTICFLFISQHSTVHRSLLLYAIGHWLLNVLFGDYLFTHCEADHLFTHCEAANRATFFFKLSRNKAMFGKTQITLGANLSRIVHGDGFQKWDLTTFTNV